MALPVETRLERLLRRGDIVAENCPLMGEYWYRPGEVLVHRDDCERLARELDRWEATPCELPERLRSLREVDFPVQRYRLSERMSVDAVVTRLRQVADGPEPRVGPNLVLGAMQSWAFFPGDNAVPSDDRLELPKADAGRFIVAVIDTGLVTSGEADEFVGAAGARLVAGAADEDPLDVEPQDGWLDDADAHGTFVAGIVLREAPGATVRCDGVLNNGIADELEVADAIIRNGDADVINLSLGAYAPHDVPPLSIVEAINGLRPEVAVVAAAGNYGRRRPLFPAALKRVIAVAAVDDTVPTDGLPPRASFSNHGWWVDACAPGQSVLSNFVRFAEPDGTTFDGWARWSGTSFAAPRVAGIIAAKAMASGRPANEVAFELVYGSGLPWRPDLGTLV